MAKMTDRSRIPGKNKPPGEVIGDFQVDGWECWIVKEESGYRETPQSSLKEVCRFKARGQSCLIVCRERSCSLRERGVLLTARELQIATLVAMGCPNKQVADKLHISEWTVGTYLRRMFAKLGVDTRAALTYRCAALIGSRESAPGSTGTPSN